MNLNLKNSSKILEMGCGPGELTRYLCAQGYDAKGIDVSQDMITYGESIPVLPEIKEKLSCQNAEKTCYDDNQFDYVVAASLINVANNPEKIINEMLRVAKKDGKISVLYPTVEMNMMNIKKFIQENKLSKMSETALTTWAKLSKKMSNDEIKKIIDRKNTHEIKFDSLFKGMVATATATKR